MEPRALYDWIEYKHCADPFRLILSVDSPRADCLYSMGQPGRTAAAPSILEPFLAYLVAAHMKLPDLSGHALEVLSLVDVDIARAAILIGYEFGKALLHGVVANHRIAGYELAEIRALQQVQRHQLLAQDAQLSE